MHIASKLLLPAGIGGNIVADGRAEVKIEQNNLFLSYPYGYAGRFFSMAVYNEPACVTTVHTRWVSCREEV